MSSLNDRIDTQELRDTINSMGVDSLLRKTGFFAGILFIVVLALSLFFAIQNYQDARHKDEAIVMTSTVMVKSSPSVSSVDLFVLHEGAKVRILDANEEWNKIKIANGSVGWIQIKDIAAF